MKRVRHIFFLPLLLLASWSAYAQQTTAPIIVTPAANSVISTLTPTYSGTAPANSTIIVYVGTAGFGLYNISNVGTTTAGASGAWSLTPSAAQPVGSRGVYATAQASGQFTSPNSNTNYFTIDIPPSVAVSSLAGASGSTTGTSPLPVTVTFSETVTGFVQGDLTVTGGTVSGFSGSGATYTFFLTPTAVGNTVTVDVPANVAQDGTSNGNTAATQYSVTFSQPVIATAQNVTVTFSAGGTGTLSASSVNNGSTGAGTLTYSIQKIVYGRVLESNNLTLTTPNGASFTAIPFASYGTPVDNGNGNYSLSACNAANSVATAQNSFVGKSTGIMAATNFSNSYNNPALGDPCSGPLKSLAVQAAYSANATSLTYDATETGKTQYVLLTVTSSNGNIGTAVAQVIVNTPAPALTATVSTTSANPATTAPIPFSVSFSQSVGTTFIASDLTVTGGTLVGNSFTGTGAGPYSFNVAPSGSGTISVSLATGMAQDANNTGNSASNTVSVQYQQTAVPVVTTPAYNFGSTYVNTTTPTYAGTAPANSTVTVYVGNSTFGGLYNVVNVGTTTADPSGNWSLTQPTALNQTGYGFYAKAQLSGQAISNNSNTNYFIVDTVSPGATINSTAGASGSTTGTSPIPFTVIFTENMTGFTASDLVVTGGTVSGFGMGSSNYYGFNVTPTGFGTTVTVEIPVNVAQDAAGNGNKAIAQYSITYLQPTAAPVVTTPANNSLLLTTTPTYTGTAPAGSTVTVYVDNAAIGTATADASGAWSLTQPTALGQGNHSLYTTAQLSGQAVSAASATSIFTVDTVPPTATISSTAGASGSTTTTSPVPFTVSFSENVTGFVQGDLTVTGGTISGFTAAFANVYTFNVTPGSSGAITVNVAANTAQDAAGNGNTAASQFSITANLPPVANAQAVTVQLGTNGSATLNASSVNNGSTGAGTLSYSIQKIVYGSVPENSTLTLTTPSGAVFTAIPFASFGTPVDNGNGNYSLSTCDAANSVATAQNSFVGNSTGSMDATNSGSANNNPTLGDPCPNTAKWLAVQAAYSADAASLSYNCTEAGKTQYVLLTVTSSNGTVSTAVAQVTVVAPPTATISSLSPNAAPRGATVTVTGTNLSGIGSTVTVNGATAAVSGLSATGFTFIVPNTATFGAGNVTGTTSCSQTPAAAFTVQQTTVSPILTAPSGFVTFTTPSYVGVAPALSTVRVYVDNALVGTTTANGSGNWNFNPFITLSQGSHTVYATAQLSGQAVSAASGTNSFIVDSVPPSVAISSTAGVSGGTTGTSPVPFTITFSESVSGFVQGDLSVSGGSISGFSGTGTTYTFNVTPVSSGTTVTVNVAANVAQDLVGNGNTAASQFSILYQLTTASPVLAIPANNSILATAMPTYSGTAPAFSTVTVYVDGSAVGTAVATNAGNWSLNPSTALGQGSHTVYTTAQLSGQAVSAASNTRTFIVDSVPPSVAISSTAGVSGGGTGTSPVPFTITFSENVTGFVQGDLTVTGGTISGFTAVSATVYTFNVTPGSAGIAVTVNVPANVAQDVASNLNTAASQFSITYQQATVTAVTGLTLTPAATAQVSYQVTFSSAISGLTTGNFSVSSTTTGAGVASVTGSGASYTVVVNTGTGDGTLNLDIQNSTGLSHNITNLPYTTGTVYTITKSFAAAPVLSIQAVGSASSSANDVTAFVDMVQVLQSGTSTAVTNALQNSSFETNNVIPGSFRYQSQSVAASPWNFGVQSGVSRNSSGFGSTAYNGNAVALLQSTGGNNGSISQSLAVPTGSYQINFQAIQRNYATLDQQLNVFVGGVFVGNIQPNNTPTYDAFTSAAFTVTAPALVATVSTTSASPTSTAPIPFSVSFSQSVGTTFTASDLTVAGGVLTGGSFAGSGAGPYTFTVTPTGAGAVSVSLAAAVASDANNTDNAASNTVNVQYSQPVTAMPVIVIPSNGTFVAATTPTYGGTAPAGATIRAYVDGVLLSATATANSAGNWVLAQPTALNEGSHTIYATAQLSGQTVSANSVTNTFTVDVTRPTVAISSTSGTSGSTTSTTPIPFTVTFSEAVTGFVPGDLSVTGGSSISGFSGSGAAYTFNVTPASSGSTVTVNVPANVAQDQAGNGNFAASQYGINYQAPTIVVSPASLPNATKGSAYSVTFSAAGGTAPYTYAITAGALPTGLSLSGNTILGTPTASATFNFTVTATDNSAAPGPYSGSRSYTFTTATPLPVDLLSITARNAGARNEVAWTVANEDNLASYIVERSADGVAFERMAEVVAAGKPEYSVYDNTPAVGRTFYRLIMANIDGATEYSRTVQAVRTATSEIVLNAMPNPFLQEVRVSVSGVQSGQVRLSDGSGRTVATGVVANGEAVIQTADLAAGPYFLHFSNGSVSQTIKVIKQ